MDVRHGIHHLGIPLYSISQQRQPPFEAGLTQINFVIAAQLGPFFDLQGWVGCPLDN